jgi:hypothetical protein
MRIHDGPSNAFVQTIPATVGVYYYSQSLFRAIGFVVIDCYLGDRHVDIFLFAHRDVSGAG